MTGAQLQLDKWWVTALSPLGQSRFTPGPLPLPTRTPGLVRMPHQFTVPSSSGVRSVRNVMSDSSKEPCSDAEPEPSPRSCLRGQCDAVAPGLSSPQALWFKQPASPGRSALHGATWCCTTPSHPDRALSRARRIAAVEAVNDSIAMRAPAAA